MDKHKTYREENHLILLKMKLLESQQKILNEKQLMLNNEQKLLHDHWKILTEEKDLLEKNKPSRFTVISEHKTEDIHNLLKCIRIDDEDACVESGCVWDKDKCLDKLDKEEILEEENTN